MWKQKRKTKELLAQLSEFRSLGGRNALRCPEIYVESDYKNFLEHVQAVPSFVSLKKERKESGARGSGGGVFLF